MDLCLPGPKSSSFISYIFTRVPNWVSQNQESTLPNKQHLTMVEIRRSLQALMLAIGSLLATQTALQGSQVYLSSLQRNTAASIASLSNDAPSLLHIPHQQHLRDTPFESRDNNQATDLDAKRFVSSSCDSNWENTRDEFQRNQPKWKNYACYSFELRRQNYNFPRGQRPLRIHVVNDSVERMDDIENPAVHVPLRPSQVGHLPTMNQLFSRIKDDCFKSCPETGAQYCSVEYDIHHGAISSLYINARHYHISKLQVCHGNDNEPPPTLLSD